MSRGGARPGSGRPALFDRETERRSLILPVETWKALEALAIVMDVPVAHAAYISIETQAEAIGLRRRTIEDVIHA